MIKGLYTAAMGMNVQAKRLDVVSNDLANASTTGYKRDKTTVSSFKDEYLTRLKDSQHNIPNKERIGKITYGAKIDEVYTDFQQGTLMSTESNTNVAIQGEGFFTVQMANGNIGYTRDGSFNVTPNGALVTKEGYAVMGENGPIQLGENYLNSGERLTITNTGNIKVGENDIGNRLAMVSFEDPNALQKAADNLYTGGNPGAFTGQVLQGYLESSNVNTVDAMVDMIAISRAYETNQKMVQTQDNILGKTVNDLGRV